MNRIKRCCHRCLGDYQLKEEIKNRREAFGRCQFCSEPAENLISPVELREYFELLASSYEGADQGEPLVHWFKNDWSLFKELSDPVATDLLSEILQSDHFSRSLFRPKKAESSANLGRWRELRAELMEENRFFPKKSIDLERMSYLLSQLMFKDEMPDIWYRARLQKDGNTYSVDQMGPPPKNLARHGRANPVGIPYLYMASDTGTAISETRPHTGEKLSVAHFSVNESCKLIDLRNPRKLVSPFISEDANQIAALRSDLEFLENLGEELTRPVLPSSAAIDYVPSQYLCELIKRDGYDGVVYRSAVSEGMNFALFYPEKAEPLQVDSHYVERVSVHIAST